MATIRPPPPGTVPNGWYVVRETAPHRIGPFATLGEAQTYEAGMPGEIVASEELAARLFPSVLEHTEIHDER